MPALGAMPSNLLALCSLRFALSLTLRGAAHRRDGRQLLYDPQNEDEKQTVADESDGA